MNHSTTAPLQLSKLLRTSGGTCKARDVLTSEGNFISVLWNINGASQVGMGEVLQLQSSLRYFFWSVVVDFCSTFPWLMSCMEAAGAVHQEVVEMWWELWPVVSHFFCKLFLGLPIYFWKRVGFLWVHALRQNVPMYQFSLLGNAPVCREKDMTDLTLPPLLECFSQWCWEPLEKRYLCLFSPVISFLPSSHFQKSFWRFSAAAETL